MKYYTVSNWKKFQHYKDRNPPWIKLHFELLSSADWVMLDDNSRVLAIACMLIASRNDGTVPDNPEYIKRVAYLNETPNFKPLLDSGFLQVASDCKQMLADARPETETEAEAEAEAEGVPVKPATHAKPKTFKQWKKEDLEKSVRENNTDGILNDSEVLDFVGYWTQTTATGRFLFATEKTFDTRRRMQNAVRMIYEKRRVNGKPIDRKQEAYEIELARQRARGGLPFDEAAKSEKDQQAEKRRLFHWAACDGKCKNWNTVNLWCEKDVKKQPLKAEECKEFEGVKQ
jgi:hypothetical protein